MRVTDQERHLASSFADAVQLARKRQSSPIDNNRMISAPAFGEVPPRHQCASTKPDEETETSTERDPEHRIGAERWAGATSIS